MSFDPNLQGMETHPGWNDFKEWCVIHDISPILPAEFYLYWSAFIIGWNSCYAFYDNSKEI